MERRSVLSIPITEQRNPASFKIDTKSTEEILRIINSEDAKVAKAVEHVIPDISALVDDVVCTLKNNGRLFYIGAGTAGRLGVVDAAECPPTFGVSPDMVQAIIAGGKDAMTSAIEGAEDDIELGVHDLQDRGFSSDDLLIGNSASGNAPYVIGALFYAKSIGATTAAISSNPDAKAYGIAKHSIYLAVGPEVIAGSSRMKAGTAEKMVLNMISTASMIKLGKVYNNYMIDVKPLNEKLHKRAERIVAEIAECSAADAKDLLSQCGYSVRHAILMGMLGISKDEAAKLLEDNGGSINASLDAFYDR